MATAQAGIFVEGTTHHHFLEYAATAEADGVRRALAGLPAGAGGPNLVIAFGPSLWRRLAPAAGPEGFRPFAPIGEPAAPLAPATQLDIWCWIHGDGIDDTLDLALAVHRCLAPAARLAHEVKGFTYHDSRDLTGFVDGTANPKGEAARAAALVPDGAPGAGGAFVLGQRWVHDLESFAALPVPEQERVIGRTKADSIELEGDAMPADAHVARTDIAVGGVPQKIYRRSAPYGTVREHGLYFLAFACAQTRFDTLLASMFATAGSGPRDRLTHFSRPVTGAYWFAPSAEALAALRAEA